MTRIERLTKERDEYYRRWKKAEQENQRMKFLLDALAADVNALREILKGKSKHD